MKRVVLPCFALTILYLKVCPTPTPHSLYVKGDSQNSPESKYGDLVFELNVELVIWTLL